ncbi:YqcI/YcgG family protein [Streptomyces sp. NPDC058613]|uniref:YqcI/YcgG family protein n=1 Tax=unclassified Streptomyces TaxID=2593676 RepID=UPI003654E4A2
MCPCRCVDSNRECRVSHDLGRTTRTSGSRLLDFVECSSAVSEVPLFDSSSFVARRGESATLDDDHAAFRQILLTLLEVGGEWPAEAPVDPADPQWNFWYKGIDFFINVSTRHHRLRRSRNLGHPFTLVVQSRASFDRLPVHATAARRQIRRRIAAYDGVGLSPHLGTHGDAPELPQYFLGDSNGCPYTAVTAHDVTAYINTTQGRA